MTTHKRLPSVRPWVAAAAATVLTAGLFTTVACSTRSEATPAPTAGSPAATALTAADREAQVERGRYLVMVGGCNDCHTPWVMGPQGPAPDETRLLSGHPQDVPITAPPAAPGEAPWVWQGAGTNTAFAGPWGVSFTANLTPDEATGTGAWSEEIFIRTLRTGRHWGQSRPILPPMPWFNYGKMEEADLQAIFAYLRSIPPVKNRVPDPLPPPAAAEGEVTASEPAPAAPATAASRS
jgi:mono/diheme cytochrome c family protein